MQKAKELKSLALTAADWARRKGMGEEAVRYARSYAFEAERRMGEMLKETSPARSPNPKPPISQRASTGSTSDVKLGRLPLAQLGITRNESARAQLLAELPRPVFDAVKSGKKTLAETEREIRKAKQVKREHEAVESAKQQDAFCTFSRGQTRSRIVRAFMRGFSWTLLAISSWSRRRAASTNSENSSTTEPTAGPRSTAYQSSNFGRRGSRKREL